MKDNDSIDDKVEDAKPEETTLKDAKCLHAGKLQYRSRSEHKGLFYCALSETTCPYYKKILNHEYCTAHKKGLY